MELRLSVRKTRKIKRDIFRGIYEDNLRMTGQLEPRARKNRPGILLPASALLLAAVAAIMGVQRLTNPATKPDYVPLPDTVQAITPARAQLLDMHKTTATGTAPSQYSLFLKDSSLSLRALFGLKIKTIVIDPGHGGDDPGAVGRRGIKEKDITLDVAKKLRTRLQKHPGYVIHLTREHDITLSLQDRIEFANTRDADLYISIHVNYLPNEPLNVIETYYFGPNTDPSTLRLAERENRGGPYTLNDFTRIIEKIGNTVKTQESRLLAGHIQRSMYQHIHRENHNTSDFGVKTAPFTVLLGVDIPSVLSEMTCLSNGEEERKLTNEKYREQIAGFLEEGIIGYLVSINKPEEKGVQHDGPGRTSGH